MVEVVGIIHKNLVIHPFGMMFITNPLTVITVPKRL